MNVTYTSSIEIYFAKVEPMLLKKEACNNLMLGLMDQIANNAKQKNDGYTLGYVEEGEQIVDAFMQTSLNNWVLADVETSNTSTIEAIAGSIHDKGLPVPGILGPIESVEAFVKARKRLNNTAAFVHMNQLIYQLDHVQVKPSTGRLIQATEKDHSLIGNWIFRFGMEANAIISQYKADQMAMDYLKNKSVYLWEVNSKPVSMVNKSRKTKHGVTLSAVFTPDIFKRKGYATSLVAAMSQKLLDEGFQFCSLYTDSANPTANSIYKKIGYYEVGSSVNYHFTD